MSLHRFNADPSRVKVNVEYPAISASVVAYYHVGFIPALKGGTFSSNLRKRLGIEPDDEIPASLVGSVLELNPPPSSNLETATAGRDDWEDTTPMDAGETLFGPMHR